MELIEIRKCAESKLAALPLPNPPNVQCHHLNRWIVLSAVCVRESQVWFVSGWGSTSSTYLIFSNLCSVFHKPTAFQPFFRSFATFCNFPLYRMWNNTSDRKSMVACLLGERRTETKQGVKQSFCNDATRKWSCSEFNVCLLHWSCVFNNYVI